MVKTWIGLLRPKSFIFLIFFVVFHLFCWTCLKLRLVEVDKGPLRGTTFLDDHFKSYMFWYSKQITQSVFKYFQNFGRFWLFYSVLIISYCIVSGGTGVNLNILSSVISAYFWKNLQSFSVLRTHIGIIQVFRASGDRKSHWGFDNKLLGNSFLAIEYFFNFLISQIFAIFFILLDVFSNFLRTFFVF